MQTLINRRALIAGAFSVGATAMATSSGLARPRKGFFERTGLPIGLQLYTLGEEPAKDLDGTLAKVAALGYRDLELPNLYGKSPKDLKAAADRAGVRFSAIHLAAMQGMAGGGLSFMSETQRIVDDLGTMGIKDAVMPILMIPDNFRTAKGATFQEKIVNALAEAGPDGFKKTADLLNEKASALAPHGITVGYHNHNIEFAPIAKSGGGTTTGWDVLAGAVDKKLVKFEVDLGWVAAAGLDPATFLAQHKGRVRWVHVKDVKASTKTNFALNMDPTETGAGKQDWTRILPAAQKAGVKHFYVEQEPPFAIARMEAIARSYAYLSKVVG